MGFTQSQDLTTVRDYLDSLASKSLFSGVVLIGDDSSIAFEHTAGFSSRNPEIPVDQNDSFQIASITKQFTAALILHLFKEHHLDLKTTIGRFLSWYPNSYKDSVSIHHLLAHQSGIPNYTNLPEWPSIASESFEPKDFVSFFAHHPLKFEPGSSFSYSNSNYYLLGLIAESITGQSFQNLLRKYFFDPLAMHNSGTLNQADEPGVNLAHGYERLQNGVIEPAPSQHYTTAFSVSGIYSTVQDLFKWTNSLMSGKVLSDSLLKLMISSKKNGYGYGVVHSRMIPRNVSERIRHPFSSPYHSKGYQSISMIWHWGSNPGFNSFLGYLPESKSIIVCLENITQLDSGQETMIPEIVQKIILAFKRE